MSERSPGSREEDAWLSDAQLERCAPAETEPFQGPVPTRMISNGEYMPFPQTQKQKQVESRVKELSGKASKKLGMTRRQFLEGTGGLAASFLAMNEVYGNAFFKVDEVEMFEKAAFAENATPRNLFVFDDQTHIVRSSTNTPQGLRALAQGPGSVSTAAGFSPATTPPHGNPNNGRGGNPAGVDELGATWTPWNPTQLHPDFPPNPGPAPTVAGEFHLGQYINRMYLEGQTIVSILCKIGNTTGREGGELSSDVCSTDLHRTAIPTTAAAETRPVSMSSAQRGHLGTRPSSIPIFLRIPVRRPRWPANSISASTSTGCIWKRRRASPSSATRTSRSSRRPADARPGRLPTSTTAW